MAKNSKNLSPKKVSAAVLKAMRQYFSSDLGITYQKLRDFVKNKYAKFRPFVFSAKGRPYGISGGVGRVKGGGNTDYTHTFFPVPAKGGRVVIAPALAEAKGVLKVVHWADPKAYPKVLKTLKRSSAWRRHLGEGSNSEARIKDGSIVKELYSGVAA